MKTAPLQPARITWDADGTPLSADYGDVYRARGDASAQATAVFLAGNGLPARWRGCSDFTIAETGFGLGHNFLATWRAWRDDGERPQRLHVVAFEAHPPTRDDLVRAQVEGPLVDLARRLADAWPPAIAGMHRLDFEGGALRLLLAFGDVRDTLPALDFAADAFFLDGFAPALNPAMWERRVLKALGRRARPGATAATWCVARALRDGLAEAGFVCERIPGPGRKREVLHARYSPRPGQAAPLRANTNERRAAVVGAGVAGASVAAALAGLGYEVDVFDRAAGPAEGSSGNPAGLFHATVHAGDGPYARLFRAGALHSARALAAQGSRVPHATEGLLRLELELDLAAMHSLLEAQGLPPAFVQALAPEEASRVAGVPLTAPCWLYPQGGWVSPPAWVQALVDHPGIRFHGGCSVTTLRRTAQGWQLCGDDPQPVAETPNLVLANADGAETLLTALGWPSLALQRSRGQVSAFGGERVPLRLPLAGDGYALPLPGGGLLCGATAQPGDDDPTVRDQDHRANFERLHRLCGLRPPADPERWQGRVGWRVQPADRLPLAGPMPALGLGAERATIPPSRLPREPGLHLLCGLGARGLTLAPLLGEVVAAGIAGTPVPLERSLLDAVDPARGWLRAARRPQR